jgi:hypothetical protein
MLTEPVTWIDMKRLWHRARLSGGLIEGSTVPPTSEEGTPERIICRGCGCSPPVGAIQFVELITGFIAPDLGGEIKGVTFHSCNKESCIQRCYLQMRPKMMQPSTLTAFRVLTSAEISILFPHTIEHLEKIIRVLIKESASAMIAGHHNS